MNSLEESRIAGFRTDLHKIILREDRQTPIFPIQLRQVKYYQHIAVMVLQITQNMHYILTPLYMYILLYNYAFALCDVFFFLLFYLFFFSFLQDIDNTE